MNSIKSLCFLGGISAAFLLTGCYESGHMNKDAADDITADEVAEPAGDMIRDPDAVIDPDADADPVEITDPDNAGDPDGSEEIVCQFGTAFVAQFDKACSGVVDCVIVHLSLDCCGTTLAAGVNGSEETRFNEAWADCVLEMPMCGCPSGPPVAEDGNSTMNLEDIRVDCMEGKCMTYIP